MLASDVSTLPLRGFLKYLGYPVAGWRAGRGIGIAAALREGMAPALHRLTDRHGQPASVIGWCIGGFYTRRLALRFPDEVRQVITLGTPFRITGSRVGLEVPRTAIFSRSDGMVPWVACRERAAMRAENIPVVSSHLGFGHNPSVLWAIADRLAQDPEHWKAFVPPPGLSALFPKREARQPAHRAARVAPAA